MSINPHMDACEHAPYCCITHRLRPYWCRVCNTRALFPELHPQPSCPVMVHAPGTMLQPQLAVVPTMTQSATIHSPACQGTGQICTRRRVDTCPDSCPMTQPMIVTSPGYAVPASMVVAPSTVVTPSMGHIRVASYSNSTTCPVSSPSFSPSRPREG